MDAKDGKLGGCPRTEAVARESWFEAHKKYIVAGWATVDSKSPGAPIWDVVADYLRLQKGQVVIKKLNTPKLKNIQGNPSVADYPV
ncbi:hypothetical protein QUF61_08050 [Candidatus Venteria ishoeyi]|uniref:Uncharacterized protein n=2 Tax=Candidatus Venteria ishoeyi TaxID=1899563 RepID=A0A1H6FER2_9GAMM|nr:hypothetical protein [Candidatus Venteria ishoeyi]MDM8546433.1 hypothetical protein [Candidatus Venteria ishoeyi]SEH08507.1 Uncharacterised protein [Candidatus Venteria ishoeyi]